MATIYNYKDGPNYNRDPGNGRRGVDRCRRYSRLAHWGGRPPRRRPRLPPTQPQAAHAWRPMKPCPRCNEPRCIQCTRCVCSCYTRGDAFSDESCRCPPPDLRPLDAVRVTAPCPTHHCQETLRVYVIPTTGAATLDTRDETHPCVEQWTREQHIQFQNDAADAFSTLQHWRRTGNLDDVTACGAGIFSVDCHTDIRTAATCPLCEGERRRDLFQLTRTR